MPLNQETILNELDRDVALFVTTRARDAAGSDVLRQEWWGYIFGIAYFDHGADVRLAAEVADQVLVDQPMPALELEDSATEPAGSVTV